MKKRLLCAIVTGIVASHANATCIDLPPNTAKCYLQVIDDGKSYPWFYEKDSRLTRIDQHLPYLSKEQRSLLLSDKDARGFSPRNGDVGRLVLNMAPNEEKVVINIDGHFVLINSAAVKEVSAKK